MMASLLAALLAFAPPGPSGGDPNVEKQRMLVQFGMIGVMMVIFWVMLIRPQQKRAKEQATLLKSLKPGDKVATSAGIIGVVVSLKENTVTLRSADTKLEVTKNSISDVTERAPN